MKAPEFKPLKLFTRKEVHYSKKRPRELAAVLNNLKRYSDLLKYAKNFKDVAAGFIHDEGKGLIALDQKGGGPSLQQTRLYIYPCEKDCTVYLITIGGKKEQQDDITDGHKFIESLLNK